MDSFFDYYIWDVYEVLDWLLETIRSFLSSLFDSEYSWLFYLALLPALLMFVFDILMTFILSVRLREFRFFNVVSPKSWRMVNEVRNRSVNNNLSSDLKNHPRDYFLKYTRLSSLAVRLNQYKHAKAGDIIRCKDGFKSIYQGVKLKKDGTVLYKYETNSKVLFSTLKPSQWSKSTGSQRMNSVKFHIDKNKK